MVKKETVPQHICGRIFQLCNDEPKVYFRAVTSLSDAIVRIDNDTKCMMTAMITLRNGEQVIGNIEQGQQVSFHVPSINQLQIECTGDHGICKGHYHIQFTKWNSPQKGEG